MMIRTTGRGRRARSLCERSAPAGARSRSGDFLEHKSLYATKGEVPDREIVDTLATAKIVASGQEPATILALALRCAGSQASGSSRHETGHSTAR